MAGVLCDVAQSCALEAEARQCRLVVNDSSTGALHGDPELLRRAVENVVRNAIRYAPPQTEVDVRAEDSASGLVVTVRDAGSGEPETTRLRAAVPRARRAAAAARRRRPG